jgi:hypothetical protein
MGPLQGLLAVNHRQVLEYFAAGLRDVSESSVDQQELLYSASVLAHYAQTSTNSCIGWPTPTGLGDVFDQFVAQARLADSESLETAAAECLLLTGFFEDQMRRRYNIHWYAQLGATFFVRASVRQESARKARLLETMARRFEPWRQRYARLSRELRDQQYLLRGRPS